MVDPNLTGEQPNKYGTCRLYTSMIGTLQASCSISQS